MKRMAQRNAIHTAFGIDSSSIDAVLGCLAMRQRLMGKEFEELEVLIGEKNYLWKEQAS